MLFGIIVVEITKLQTPMEIIIVVIDQYVFGFDHDF